MQILISKLYTFTSTYPAVKYGIKREKKRKALSVADKLDISKKVGIQLHVT
jgi:hypothetical protein